MTKKKILTDNRQMMDFLKTYSPVGDELGLHKSLPEFCTIITFKLESIDSIHLRYENHTQIINLKLTERGLLVESGVKKVIYMNDSTNTSLLILLALFQL